LPLTSAIEKALGVDPETKAVARVAAQEITISFAKLVQRAMLLDKEDLGSPRAILGIDAGSAEANARLNTPWDLLLADNRSLSSVDVSTGRVKSGAVASTTDPGLFSRMRFWSWGQIGGRLAEAIWRILPRKVSRGTFLMARPNPFAEQAAAHLALSGFAIGRLSVGLPKALAMTDSAVYRKSRKILRPILAEYLSRWVEQSLIPRLVHLFEGRLSVAIGQFEASKSAWRVVLGEQASDAPLAILTNMLVRPHFLALYAVAREMNLPVISFQHGHSRELTSEDRCFLVSLEEAACDLMICYDQYAAEVTERNPFSIAKAVGVGAAADFHRAGRYRPRNPKSPPIFYVSTALYTSHLQVGEFSWSDEDKAHHEIDLIRNVISRLPHRVLFKAYPIRHYADPDPIAEFARQSKNVEVFDADIDLRYLLPDARLLITSRASSTLGWCLVPGIPLVYIEFPMQMMLNPVIRPLMEKAIFFFDAAEAGWQEGLREFLSQPIEQIETQWNQRRAARDELVERFFSTGGAGSGERAAKVIRDFIRERRPVA
jgi:hypothetical protein